MLQNALAGNFHQSDGNTARHIPIEDTGQYPNRENDIQKKRQFKFFKILTPNGNEKGKQ